MKYNNGPSGIRAHGYSGSRPTPAQRRYIKGLARRRGVRYIAFYNMQEASDEIDRLKALPEKE